MRTNYQLCIAAFATIAAFGACSGGGGGGTASTGSVTGPTTPTTPTTPTVPTPTVPAGVVPITVSEYAYGPGSITVAVGTTVQWTNTGTLPHTTVSDGGTWDSGSISAMSSGGTDPYTGAITPASAAGTFTFVFTTPCVYKYHCVFHPPSIYPGFTGTITVQ